MRRFVSALVLVAGLAAMTQAAAQGARAGSDRLVFAVSEGTSGAQDATEVMLKYEDFVAFVSKTIGRRVVFYLARDFSSLEAGMREGRLDFVMARPSDYPARGIRDYGYSLVATTKGDGYVAVIVDKDSPIKAMADLSGKRLALPQDISYMGRMATAFLRDNKIDVKSEPSISYHRDQAVIGYAVEQKMADAGLVASYSNVARNWEKKGGRVIARGPLQPYMPIVAARTVSADEVAKLRRALLGMDKADDGRAILKRIGVPGFEERDPQDLLKLLRWLGV